MTLSSWCLLLAAQPTKEMLVWGMDSGAVKVLLVSLIGVALVAGLFAWAYRQYAITCQMKAVLAESEVRRYASMLGDALTDAAELELKADAIDPRIAALPPEKVKQIIADILKPMQHSPIVIHIDATNDSEAATEIMQFLVGPLEVERE